MFVVFGVGGCEFGMSCRSGGRRACYLRFSWLLVCCSAGSSVLELPCCYRVLVVHELRWIFVCCDWPVCLGSCKFVLVIWVFIVVNFLVLLRG